MDPEWIDYATYLPSREMAAPSIELAPELKVSCCSTNSVEVPAGRRSANQTAAVIPASKTTVPSNIPRFRDQNGFLSTGSRALCGVSSLISATGATN